MLSIALSLTLSQYFIEHRTSIDRHCSCREVSRVIRFTCSPASGSVRGCVCVCLWPSDGGLYVEGLFYRCLIGFSTGKGVWDKSFTTVFAFSKYVFKPTAHVLVYHSEPSVSHKQHVLIRACLLIYSSSPFLDCARGNSPMRMTESLFIFFRKLVWLFCSEGETLRKEGSAGSGAAFMNSVSAL